MKRRDLHRTGIYLSIHATYPDAIYTSHYTYRRPWRNTVRIICFPVFYTCARSHTHTYKATRTRSNGTAGQHFGISWARCFWVIIMLFYLPVTPEVSNSARETEWPVPVLQFGLFGLFFKRFVTQRLSNDGLSRHVRVLLVRGKLMSTIHAGSHARTKR